MNDESKKFILFVYFFLSPYASLSHLVLDRIYIYSIESHDRAINYSQKLFSQFLISKLIIIKIVSLNIDRV